jgi:hypothetical protein
MRRRPIKLSAHSRPTKMSPNSQRILPLATPNRYGTRGMLRHCLIHPVAPLLSSFAPLFRPFFSAVRGVPDAANLRFKPLESCDFCADFRHPAGRKGGFPPVIWAKQESVAELPQIAIPAPELMSALSKPSMALPRGEGRFPVISRLVVFCPGYARENSRFRRIGRRGRKQLKQNRLLGMGGIGFGACGNFFPVFPGEPGKFGTRRVTG